MSGIEYLRQSYQTIVSRWIFHSHLSPDHTHRLRSKIFTFSSLPSPPSLYHPLSLSPRQIRVSGLEKLHLIIKQRKITPEQRDRRTIATTTNSTESHCCKECNGSRPVNSLDGRLCVTLKSIGIIQARSHIERHRCMSPRSFRSRKSTGRH